MRAFIHAGARSAPLSTAAQISLPAWVASLRSMVGFLNGAAPLYLYLSDPLNGCNSLTIHICQRLEAPRRQTNRSGFYRSVSLPSTRMWLSFIVPAYSRVALIGFRISVPN
jgi:hypothetical protein